MLKELNKEKQKFVAKIALLKQKQEAGSKARINYCVESIDKIQKQVTEYKQFQVTTRRVQAEMANIARQSFEENMDALKVEKKSALEQKRRECGEKLRTIQEQN